MANHRFDTMADMVIAQAILTDTLVVKTRKGRFHDFASLYDKKGLIEVYNSKAQADARIAAIKEAMK